MQINDVKIAGHLVKQAEVHYTPQGTPVANVSIGVNENYIRSDNEKRTSTTFCDVQLWGAAADIASAAEDELKQLEEKRQKLETQRDKALRSLQGATTQSEVQKYHALLDSINGALAEVGQRANEVAHGAAHYRESLDRFAGGLGGYAG